MKQLGNKIVRLDSVDSTNNFAANLLREGKIGHGTVILADEQTAGKGQRGASWHSQGGSNLIFTVVVGYDNLSVDRQEAITHWVALAVHDLLHSEGIGSQIKWPNDVLVENAKMCGILIENQLSGGQIRHSIVGIGINVNQLEFGDLRATSMHLCTGRVYDIQELAFRLIQCLNERMKSFGNLRDAYHEQLWNRGKVVTFYRDGHAEEGRLIGTDDQGRLLIDVGGQLQSFGLKEITFFA